MIKRINFYKILPMIIIMFLPYCIAFNSAVTTFVPHDDITKGFLNMKLD